ncbi:MAG: hypothetical protein JSV49_11445 [Thermoplasmata archaeon]|nr:MAG: hypothetical protein JSV49_11445 [Thermoplasmata archaeon]
MTKIGLKVLVLLVIFLVISMGIPSASAGAEPQGKPFQAISERLDNIESELDNMGKWEKHGSDIAYMNGKVGIGTINPSTELDVNGVISASGGNSNDWNTAYGWGDHASAGYLTSESDPIFTGSAAYGITSTKISNWDTAYVWGDHSTAGYLTGESDPIFTGSAVYGITSTKISNWDTAYSWGDHSTVGYLTTYTETDPQVGTNSLNRIPKWDGSELVNGTLRDDGDIHIGSIVKPGDVCTGGTVTWSKHLYDRVGTRAFDNNLWTIWEAGTWGKPAWIKYDFGSGNEKWIVRYRIAAWGSYGHPTAWTFEGSNDNVNWDILDTRTGESWPLPNHQFKTFDFNNLNSYRYYRLYVTAVKPTLGPDLIIDEIEMMEGQDAITLEADGDGIFEGKITVSGGVDPPFVSFSDETYTSIREYAKNVEDHEEVMIFWNGNANRMEIYVIAEDKFYTITGQLIDE